MRNICQICQSNEDATQAAREVANKHLITGPKEKSDFCFHDIPFSLPQDEAEGNIEVEAKQNFTFQLNTRKTEKLSKKLKVQVVISLGNKWVLFAQAS